MATRHSISVNIASRDNRSLSPTKGSLTKVEWTKAERTQNAMRTFGLWFTFTFVSVFIPIAHWILVPSLFIASFILGFDKLNEETRNEGGTGECPKCHQSFAIHASKINEKFTDTCSHCREDLEISI